MDGIGLKKAITDGSCFRPITSMQLLKKNDKATTSIPNGQNEYMSCIYFIFKYR